MSLSGSSKSSCDKRESYDITGMSCSACSARVEKAVSAVSGVSSCSVSLLTNSMLVSGDASPDAVMKAVEAAGYKASRKGEAERKSKESDALMDRETPVLRRRLIWSLGFLLVLMYFSMGYTMWNFPLPDYFDKCLPAVALVQMLLAAAVMVINQRFFISGFKALFHRSPNMDTLVAIGSAASFLYSVYLTFRMLWGQSTGDIHLVHESLHGLYFESAAMILSLITVGKMLEARSKGKTTDAIRSLMELSPETARVIVDGEEREVPVENVSVGDIFVLRAGDRVPVDGVIIEGNCSVDESSLTGESIPLDKGVNGKVSSATVNISGYALCRAERVGEDTALSQIIKTVRESAATKAPIAKAADKVSGVFVPAVMAVSLITFAAWMLLRRGFGYAVIKAISVLVISCPCALGLATPVAIMVASGKGAKGGILFKTAQALEETGRAHIVVLDKTGTVTKGEPSVTDIVSAPGYGERELLSYAYSVESKSEHPLAFAVVKAGAKRNAELLASDGFETLVGNGVRAFVNGETVRGGSLAHIEGVVKVDEDMRRKAQELASQGKTPLLFAKGDSLLGIVAVADEVKSDSRSAVSALRKMGLRVVMLTGDNERTAKAVAAAVEIDEVIAGVLPDEKARKVKLLREEGKVIMVGDGINDAPALAGADIGMAIGAGTDIAIDAADVVLMNSSLSDVAAAIRLSRRALRNIHENLFWAFVYNAVGIPLAAGALAWLGLSLSPMFAALAMSLSSFCVVTNALRLNLVDIHSPKGDRKGKTNKGSKEKKQMKRTVKIEGMMCPHCEARVKQTLEGVDGVASAEVSHTAGTAIVTCADTISRDSLAKTVEAQGYKVIG